MSLLLPLGLLGLLAVGVLILIYIIRPNYQQKFVSSTYVWKLSLKYKKKKIPVSKIRNLIIFLCQLLILVCCALLLAQPVVERTKRPDVERIAIIDASASMRTEVNGMTRFERAVNRVKTLAEEISEDEGVLTVIIADGSPDFALQRAPTSNLYDIYSKLDALVEDGNLQCSYDSADMDGAVELADEVLLENPDAHIILYTGTHYTDDGGIEVADVSQAGEWNVAVTGCNAVLNEGYYDFEAVVGCYGRSEQLEVKCEVVGANGDKTFEMSKTVLFDATAETQTVTFGENDQIGALADRVAVFDSVYVSVSAADSFAEDNFYYLYGGTKPVIKLQYASSNANIFFTNALMTFRDLVKNRYTIDLNIVSSSKAVTEGFDFYIFEHTMPDVMPTDGVVFLVDPDKAPAGSDLVLGDRVTVNKDSTLAAGLPHPITDRLNPQNITVSEYRKISGADGYEELMYFQGEPVFFVKNTPTFKTAVLSVNIHKSNLVMLMEFPLMILHMYDYFIPSTFSGYTFDVGDTVALNARGESLQFVGPSESEVYTQFPQEYTLKTPGTYTLTQSSLRGDPITEHFFAGVPAEQSNITRTVDVLTSVDRFSRDDKENLDLLLYFAIALITLVAVEWFLQSREYLK